MIFVIFFNRMRIPDGRIGGYINAIEQAMASYKNKLQMIFIILQTNKVDGYSAVKRKCAVDYGSKPIILFPIFY